MSLPLLGFIYGMVRGAFNYDVKEVALKLKNLPKSFEGLRIIQFSDIHAGSFTSNSPVKEFVDLINKQNADIIFFTGDLVNEIADEADPFIKTLSGIKAPMGVFSILGNHDYGDYFRWDNANAKTENFAKIKKHHKDLGWRL
ncbi:MAG: metallophosphoesterase, partial [Bacteroidetes bacterium]|nr:metallophosphoesterase [Bacteroidota bacterium]